MSANITRPLPSYDLTLTFFTDAPQADHEITEADILNITENLPDHLNEFMDSLNKIARQNNYPYSLFISVKEKHQ